MTIPEIFETKGEEGFRAVETETLRALIEESEESPSPAVFSTGGGLPMREENRELLRQLGFCVYLKTSAGEVLLPPERRYHQASLERGQCKREGRGTFKREGALL